MWTQDGTLHKRDEDAANTTIYGSDPRGDCDVTSPITIGAIKMTNIDKTVHNQSASSKFDKKSILIDRGDCSDGASG